ncbi:beta transducin-like protein [Histomonas meleagridis]|uniref:beta transducin-like protein n=1 Tax=Histomonas meleagridis TaxID=135588 RepID=UPI00355A1B47|nr:beta transducin-like protein [Histomonas meleagridis]KAH0801846.1 beta transducin-like protein [Histomonas meleagridis]
MESLFDHGATLGQDQAKSQAVVKMALKKKNIGCLEVLLRRGLKPTSGIQKELSPLMQCIAIGLFDAVGPLIDIGADVNYVDANGSCALQLAIKQGDMDLVRLLLNKGADIHFRGSNIHLLIFGV